MTDASRHVELYRRLWSATGFELDLKKTPLLDKTFLRALLACGYRPGQCCLFLTSRRDSRWSAIARWHYASIAETTEVLADRLAALNPRVFYGPLSTLELLAEHQAKHGACPAALKLVVSNRRTADAAAAQNARARLRRTRCGFLRHDGIRPRGLSPAGKSDLCRGALECMPELRAFEVVQQRDLSIDVTIDVAAAEADRIRGVIATRLTALLGPATPLRIAAGSIRRVPSGVKYRPIRSLAGSRA